MDKLSRKAIRELTEEKFGGVEIRLFEETDSTNLQAKRFAAENGGKAVFIAESQTMGRGRFGRSFFSPEGCGIYMSFLIPTEPQALSDITLFTTAAAVAVCEAIESVCKKQPLIKWVNDLYLDGKKVCGILAEAVTDPQKGVISHVVIGLGINFRASGDLPSELEGIVGTLFGRENTEISRNELAAEVINRMLTILPAVAERKFLSKYRERSFLIGEEIVFSRGEKKYAAFAENIDENGGLVVRFKDGRHETLNSGEVSVRSAQSADSLPFAGGRRQ